MQKRVAVTGAKGRMGRLAVDLITAAPDFELVAELTSSSSLDELSGADVVFDVTTPGASETIVDRAVSEGIPIVVGTSGWTAEKLDALRARLGDGSSASVLIVPNFSLGSVLGTVLAQVAAPHFDSIEIVEAHHADKIDSPSGTAIRAAERISAARGADAPVVAPHADQTARGELVAGIPVHSLRLRGVSASQDIIFGGESEQLILRHEVLSHEAYRAGMLLALRRVSEVRGLVVGLEGLLGLDGLVERAVGDAP